MHQSSTVQYRRPARDPKLVHTIQLLLVGSAAMAVLSLWRIVYGFAALIDVADAMKASVTASGDAEALASVQVFVNLAYFAFALLAFALVAIPIRYGLLIRAMWRGHPTSVNSVRATAVMHLLVTVLGLASVLLIFGGTGYLEVGLSASMFLPALILWYTYIPATRRWFSEFRVEPLAAPGFRQVDSTAREPDQTDDEE